MMERCLYCYQLLPEGEIDYHPSCVKRFFNLEQAPVLPYSENELLELAELIVKQQKTVTGVQPKVSLEVEKAPKREIPKLAIAGLWGDYILKPPNDMYAFMPETESLTMHLAGLYGINTVPFSLIRLKGGKLAYITQRIDRVNADKVHMEDMCQLTERLTEDKYRGSYEQIGKAIKKYSDNPGLDLVSFFEVVAFSFITGNADMHLKNFSLIRLPQQGYILCSAYDLISSKLLLPEDAEEMALTLNARKNRITIRDFDAFAQSLGIGEKAKEKVWGKFIAILPLWYELIEASFLPQALIAAYKTLLAQNAKRLGLI